MLDHRRLDLVIAPPLALPSAESRFWVRLSLWLCCLSILIGAWECYNGWRLSLAIALCYLPCVATAAVIIYRENDFGCQTPANLSEWEMLIAYLLLAIGVASGILLIMAVGWISIGVVCLRPANPRTSLQEWFKIPVLCLLIFPVELDLTGSRHDWIQLFSGQPSLVHASDFSLAKMQVASRALLLVLAFGLKGAAFWLSLPTLPFIVMLACRASERLAAQRGHLLAAAGSWILLVAIPLVFLSLCKQTRGVIRTVDPAWKEIKHWASGRTYSIWLVALVVFLQQSSLLENWLSGIEPRFDLSAAFLLILVLLWNHSRSPRSEVRLFSRLLLASALFVLLAAEWTDSLFLRHLSLGLLLISGLSWRRSWPGSLLLTAAVAWVTILPSPISWLTQIGFRQRTALLLRMLSMLAAFAGVLFASRQLRLTIASREFSDPVWQPSKRFAFTLLMLLIFFQFASGIWFQQANRAVASIRPRRDIRRWNFQPDGQPIQLRLFHPPPHPIDIVSPERLLQWEGWQITSRKWISQPRGGAIELKMRKPGHTGIGTALYWFDTRQRTFPGYLAARHVLWSGWNLSHRELQLALLTSTGKSESLSAFAESWQWFEKLLWSED